MILARQGLAKKVGTILAGFTHEDLWESVRKMGMFGMIIACLATEGCASRFMCSVPCTPVLTRRHWAKVSQMLSEICFFIGYSLV
jgi:hypothetical protein